jgi:23S rRNA pseudouridine2605 synthase
MSLRTDSALPAATPVRLARYLAACGVASRRASEELIRAGLVQVNGIVVETPATTVTPGRDQVLCRGLPAVCQGTASVLLNKPPGVTCSARDAHARKLVGDLVPAHLGRLFTVGRLDRDSEGLILLTNDGDLAQRLAHPSNGVERTYEVTVHGDVGEAVLERLRQGIEDAGEFLRPLELTVAQRSREGCVLRFVLGSGRKREVRRLCRAAGLAVVVLRRVQFGPLRLGTLRPGEWRPLTPPELAALRAWRPAEVAACRHAVTRRQ